MKTRRNLSLAFFALLLSFAACKKDKDDVVICDLSDEMTAYQQKINQFSTNPTVENCNALKQASLSLLEQAKGCPAADRQEIEEATEAWKDVNCDEFQE